MTSRPLALPARVPRPGRSSKGRCTRPQTKCQQKDGDIPPAASPLQRVSALRPVGEPKPQADPELLEVLELATDEELEDLHRLLHGRSLFSPVLKSLDLERGGEEATVGRHGRAFLISAIDRRLRYLAADSGSTLRGRWPAYRQVLLMIRDKLGIRCPSTLLTNELEAEVFLHLLEKHGDAVDVGGQQPQEAAEYANQGDGAAADPERRGSTRQQEAPNLVQRLLAPLRLGQEEVVPALASLGSALAVSNLRQTLMPKLGVKLMHSHLRYEAALHLALNAGAKGAQGRVAMQAAKEGITAAASRYAAARSLLGVLGPLMWASTALDLLMVSIGTDYARVCKAVFALAQIRLLRTYGFSTSSGSTGDGAAGRS